ncbi:MAG: Beta-lactamase [Verrucomicrobiales bacterium]|nr:Beta-lactamase [Verrucomicrobiales bacterium]
MKHFLLLGIWFFTLSTALADKVDRLIKEEMDKHEIPGLALVVIKGGKQIKTAGYGFANLETKTPATKDTVFEIGSVTKQFTAAAIMILVQEGKLSVDDKISQHLKNTPKIWSDITVRHLLTHTSGIKTYTGLDGYELSKHLTQEQFIGQIGALALDSKPGDKYAYCNTGFNLLGFIIENLSGKKYMDFLGERIFGPLEMTSTTNREPSIIVPNRADGYERVKGGRWINRDSELTDIFSAGAIISTVGDMAKWDASLNTDKILTQASKQQMWTAHKLNDGSTKYYGFAWRLEPMDGHKKIAHTGSTSGFTASFSRFPDDKMSIIVLCNSGENEMANIVAKKIAPLYFSDSVAKN